MAKKKKRDRIELKMAFVHDVVSKIEHAFGEADITLTEGIMVAYVLLAHGMEHASRPDVYDPSVREQTIHSLKILLQQWEHPELFPPEMSYSVM